MKAPQSLKIACLLCVAMVPAVVQAQFTFITNNGAITITGYTGSGGAVTIPDTTNGWPVTRIGDYAFYNCYSLTGVTIGNSVTNIGNWTFSNCTSLTNVTISNNVTSIGDYAFYYCTKLTSVTVPNSVTSIGVDAFASCYGLTAITVDALNSVYSSVAGVLFDKSHTTLIQCPGGKAGSYTVPNSVTSIGNGAFSFCSSLTSVTIPNSVTNIGNNAFAICTSLKAVCFQGNAPGAGSDSSVFSGDNNATIYYLAGTTGWHTPFDGRPAFLWNPNAQSSGTMFGVRTNRFGFTITGSSNLVIVVEACTSLFNPVWQPLQTNTLNTFIGTNGTSYFSDPKWTNYPGRFYRLRSP